jgi:hypothetical protein
LLPLDSSFVVSSFVISFFFNEMPAINPRCSRIRKLVFQGANMGRDSAQGIAFEPGDCFQAL